MILQGIAGYCFWVYTAYNDVIEHIENPPVITEYKTIEVEKQVEVEKKSEQEQEVSEAYATGGKETHQDTIRRVAKAAGFQDPELLIAIAECESGSRKAHTIRPDVPNTKSTAVGAFQYLKGTWEEGVKKTGNDWSLDDRKDLEKATRMAIWHIHGGFLKKWDASKHCWNK